MDTPGSNKLWYWYAFGNLSTTSLLRLLFKLKVLITCSYFVSQICVSKALLPIWTAFKMIIDHANRLHECIDNSLTHKVHSFLF